MVQGVLRSLSVTWNRLIETGPVFVIICVFRLEPHMSDQALPHCLKVLHGLT